MTTEMQQSHVFFHPTYVIIIYADPFFGFVVSEAMWDLGMLRFYYTWSPKQIQVSLCNTMRSVVMLWASTAVALWWKACLDCVTGGQADVGRYIFIDIFLEALHKGQSSPGDGVIGTWITHFAKVLLPKDPAP